MSDVGGVAFALDLFLFTLVVVSFAILFRGFVVGVLWFGCF